MENTYLPRVWTEEGYYYPVFSEFGIIYENKNLPFDEEHITGLFNFTLQGMTLTSSISSKGLPD